MPETEAKVWGSEFRRRSDATLEAPELVRAVQHSFDVAGVTMSDHHEEARRFLKHVAKEERADVVLPGAAYTEKSATYVNTEGRAQTTARAVFPPGDAKEDWAIVRALSAHVGHRLPYDTLPALRAAMYKQAPALARLDAVEPADIKGVEALAAAGGKLSGDPFGVAIADFYLTNPIARASAVMAELSAFKQAAAQRTTGTHG